MVSNHQGNCSRVPAVSLVMRFERGNLVMCRFTSVMPVSDNACARLISGIWIASHYLWIQGCGGGGAAPQILPPSNLTYTQSNIVATVGTGIAADTPTVIGTVESYTVSPALPAGLSLNSSTGVISGTPTTVSA